jgi:hypothetical protein
MIKEEPAVPLEVLRRPFLPTSEALEAMMCEELAER